MKIKAIKLSLCMVASSLVYSQGTVTGKIYNEFKEPVYDAKVISTKTNQHAHTSKEGGFTIELIDNDTLQIEMGGYIPQFISVNELPKNQRYVLIKESKYLEDVVISSKKEIISEMVDVDLKTSTNLNSQEILTVVPGIFVAQHAGGGKSEQMFLRGFDLDHGTDINIGVDGVPVNMVSHAHGQGYTDLHFMIPNLIDKVEFGKGPYDLTKGNFTTAGYVNFKTKDILDKNTLGVSYGAFNTRNFYGAYKVFDSEKSHLYVAGSMDRRDGYFESSQNFIRNNLFAKYYHVVNASTVVKLSATSFGSSWDASGQIPLRAVESGQISRFGAIDDTEGGNTSRYGGKFELIKNFDDNSHLTTGVYGHFYNFELYSNFTFFDRDSINGDQIRQKENRFTYGFNVDYVKPIYMSNVQVDWLSGVGSRFDNSDNNELSYSKNRSETLQHVQLGDVDESNLFAYTGIDVALGNLRLYGGGRLEEFTFGYHDKLTPAYDPLTSSHVVFLPKATAKYTFTKSLGVYAKWGKGFHSNDSRLILNSPSYLALPTATSYDLGVEVKPLKNLLINVAYWNMYSQQEFVYVGDEGIVEASGQTNRQGIDFSASYQLADRFFTNLNVNYTHARTKDENEFIPLAAPLTSTANIRWFATKHLSVALASRLMGDRAANEDNSIKAKGYFINDMSVSWSSESWTFQLQVDNILNENWEETQFLTNSRLQNETEPVEEIHFTPGEPRFIRGNIIYRF